MTDRTKKIFRLKCLIQKCRERGKFNVAIRLRNKLLSI